MWLLIDDERNLDVDVIARTASAGKDMMMSYRKWECVCFDHDLGEIDTGYDVMVWAIQKSLLPNRVQLVTSNPVGRKNMRAALEREGYKTVDGINFKK
jgi:hypothetical protein